MARSTRSTGDHWRRCSQTSLQLNRISARKLRFLRAISQSSTCCLRICHLGNSQVPSVASQIVVLAKVLLPSAVCNLVFDNVCLGNIPFGSYRTKSSCNKHSSSQLRQQCRPSRILRQQVCSFPSWLPEARQTATKPNVADLSCNALSIKFFVSIIALSRSAFRC